MLQHYVNLYAYLIVTQYTPLYLFLFFCNRILTSRQINVGAPPMFNSITRPPISAMYIIPSVQTVPCKCLFCFSPLFTTIFFVCKRSVDVQQASEETAVVEYNLIMHIIRTIQTAQQKPSTVNFYFESAVSSTGVQIFKPGCKYLNRGANI